jgi:hypothetical protein
MIGLAARSTSKAARHRRRCSTRVASAAALLATLLVLSSCSAVTSFYVLRSSADEYILVAPPQCPATFESVVVKYAGDEDDTLGFDGLKTVWQAKATGTERKAVTLLQDNDGYTSEFTVDAIDTSRDMIIGWRERWPDGYIAEDSLAGDLSDIEGDELLWFDGVTSWGTYDWETSLPYAGFSC